MFKKALVIGATGMAGRAFVRYFQRMGIDVIGMSRRGPDLICDITSQSDQMIHEIIKLRPDVVVNCAACVSLEHCELYPIFAKSLNADVVADLVQACSEINARFIQISTDHYYSGDGRRLHRETDLAFPINNYARTKLAGERNALSYANGLVLRTNITGFRHDPAKPTFIEWLFDSIRERKMPTLFTDFFTCTIDCDTFASLAIGAAACNYAGLLNLASSQCLSKKEFAFAAAKGLGLRLDAYREGSVSILQPLRANSLGLDCSKAEALLGVMMPDASHVIASLVSQERLS
jgi:dTDP-4-dehydrorhamnose reductase